jgi:hypothetical protein
MNHDQWNAAAVDGVILFSNIARVSGLYAIIYDINDGDTFMMATHEEVARFVTFNFFVLSVNPVMLANELLKVMKRRERECG